MVSLQALLVVAALAAPADVEIVKFTATWCAPCQAMEPVLEQVARQGFPVRRIDVDQRRDLAEQHQVTSVPTLLIVADGQVVDRIEGAMPLEPLMAKLQSFAARPASEPQQDDRSAPAPTHVVPNSTRPTATPDLARPTGADATTIEQQAQQATVRLRIEDPDGHSFGTGTIVDVHGQDALVLTCGHIFRDSQGKGKIIVELFSTGAAEPIRGELIRYDLDRDLALIGIHTSRPLQAIPVAGPTWRVATGQRLFSMGCNHGEDPTLMRGRLKAVNKYIGPENLTVEGRPTEGRSGGGLFSYDGYLVGVCNAADPEIEEGLYAAFASIHRHLDEAKLSFVYRGKPDPDVQLAAVQTPAQSTPTPVLAAPPRDDSWSSVADAGRPSVASQLATGATYPEPNGAEVICIIRSQDDPSAKTQVVVLDRPSREFIDQLKEERRSQVDRQMTQLRVEETLTGRTRTAAEKTVPFSSPRPRVSMRDVRRPTRMHR